MRPGNRVNFVTPSEGDNYSHYFSCRNGRSVGPVIVAACAGFAGKEIAASMPAACLMTIP